jgi:hypothetical protein
MVVPNMEEQVLMPRKRSYEVAFGSAIGRKVIRRFFLQATPDSAAQPLPVNMNFSQHWERHIGPAREIIKVWVTEFFYYSTI